MKTYDKICPLLVFSGGNPKCRGHECAFAHPKQKTTVDKEGNTRYEKDGWYCLVQDFLITMANRE